MGWTESLQSAIHFIEEHLLEELPIGEIAKQANLSAFHFQRTFAALTGISVGEYIRRRRLTLAAHELSRTNRKIIELASKYGYDTPEAFTKAFRRQHGITPSEMRSGGGTFVSYNRLAIQVNLKGAEPMKVRMVEREAFRAVGVKREFSLENGESEHRIPKFWEEVNADGTCERLYQLNNSQFKGVLGISVTNPDNDARRTIDYWVAAEYEEPLQGGWLQLEVPASQWAVFEVYGTLPDAMHNMWKQIYSEWFPSSGYLQTSSIELEHYPEGDPASPDHYAEIWIPVQ